MSNSNGQVRFIFTNSNNQLSTDFNIQSIDFTVSSTCADKFASKIVRAPGEHNFWLVPDDSVRMTLDTSICAYVLSLSGLSPKTNYNWKVINLIFIFLFKKSNQIFKFSIKRFKSDKHGQKATDAMAEAIVVRLPTMPVRFVSYSRPIQAYSRSTMRSVKWLPHHLSH